MKEDLHIFCCLSDKVALLMLAFIGGYIDATGYNKLQGLFATSITGNIVAATSLVFTKHIDQFITRVVVVCAFGIAGAIITSLSIQLKLVNKLDLRHIALTLFSIDLLVMVISLIIGVLFIQDIDSSKSLGSASIVMMGALLAASMGIHDVCAKETIPNCPSTVAVTMTVVSVATNASYAFHYFLAKNGIHSKNELEQDFNDKFVRSLRKFVNSFLPLIIFIVGAFLGSIATKGMDFYSISIPIAIMVVILLDILLGIHTRTVVETEVKKRVQFVDELIHAEEEKKSGNEETKQEITNKADSDIDYNNALYSNRDEILLRQHAASSGINNNHNGDRKSTPSSPQQANTSSSKSKIRKGMELQEQKEEKEEMLKLQREAEDNDMINTWYLKSSPNVFEESRKKQ